MKPLPGTPKGATERVPRGPSYNWEEVRTLFVQTNMSRDEVCREVGCSRRSLDDQAAKGKWDKEREKYRAQFAVTLSERLEERQLSERVEAAIMVNRLKLLLLTQLTARIESGEYKATPSDIDRIERLHKDLAIPGWAKGDQGKGDGPASVDATLAEIRDKRGSVIDVGHEPVIEAQGLDPDTEGFLYEDDDGEGIIETETTEESP